MSAWTRMVLAMPVVLPSFEIATPNMITMMLTTSIISSNVKPCCFCFVLISKRPSVACAITLPRYSNIASARREEDSRTYPKYTSIESASLGLRRTRCQCRWQQLYHSFPLLRPWPAQFSGRAATRYNGNVFEALAVPLRRGNLGQPGLAALKKLGQYPDR